MNDVLVDLLLLLPSGAAAALIKAAGRETVIYPKNPLSKPIPDGTGA